ncbi:hypothetical protein LPJ78_004512 [Coemansia sp. RSA 989]|nr:hypothetical protein BX667DRAFT_500435 [Coemansia mojavensis]KAJ1739397.1 hypothetical protein LPJ68_004728 [Coemansia sp. RSA 1086]KAJ1747791.1 hypothetical protein LPJ79_004999 [Coemansia sp. RSA 1821]KAJ1862743.1 hypothetical protein LPJ78_004512 [Coemansia sp. RSA 989]KAJ1869810.1 hypothetical protein LPJ55_005108 [Coemansia sp. RSA 990]
MSNNIMQHNGQAPPPPGYTQASGPAYAGGSQYGQPHSNRTSGLQWVSESNGRIPPNPVQGGIEKDGTPLFIGRAMYKGGLHPAKVGQHLENGGCNIGYGHKEIAISEYQVLCGDASKLRWVRQQGLLNIKGFVPFPAGHEETGEPLYIAKTLYEGSQQLGKCAPHIKKGMSFPYGHKERTTDDYMVLAYAD